MFKIEVNCFGVIHFVKNTWLEVSEAQTFKTENAAQKKIEKLRFYINADVLATAKIVKV